ncbi:MAG: VaFE repeat-containing surface-anchored protein [Candidatus Saccharibacteria bacterium]|nr:VaFE repeat-containing surface-anchored protein [Candidatus Saccharibacteria bacterium]
MNTKRRRSTKRGFRILHKNRRILWAAFIGVAVISAFLGFKIKDKIHGAMAITNAGDPITIGQGEENFYEEFDNGALRFVTRDYLVTSNGETFHALCAQPTYDTPSGDALARILNDDAIRLVQFYYINPNEYIDEQKTVFGVDNYDNTSRRRIIAHEIIGQLYGRYDSASAQAALTRLQNDLPTLEPLVTNGLNAVNTYVSQESPAFKESKKYRLFISEFSNPETQDVVWIEEYAGGIKVIKKDADTHSTTPQGQATSFAGTKFGIYDSNNALVMEITAGTDGVATTGEQALAPGTYTIRELSTIDTYDVTGTYMIINVENTVVDKTNIPFENSIKRADLTVQKCDAETTECTPQPGMSFEGIKFEVINSSQNGVYYNERLIANGEVVTTGTTDENGEIVFENLPYGEYRVRETETNQSYTLETTAKTISINGNKSLRFDNTPVRGDVKFTKVDKATDNGKANVAFKIKYLATNEEHIVITNGSGVVNTASSFIQHTKDTNKYDTINTQGGAYKFAGYGTWFGGGEVRNGVGALPYGEYEISEIECDENLFCEERTETKTFKIEGSTTVNLGKWTNDCFEPQLDTEVKDAADEDKTLALNKDVEIIDTVNYCLKANERFRISGILMDKATGEPLLIDGKEVESETIITPETDCGIAEVKFKLNTSGLAGKDLVVFEKAYHQVLISGHEGESSAKYREELVVSHEDINDEAQTIHISEGIPDTGLFTIGKDGASIETVGLGIGAVIAVLYLGNHFRKVKHIRFKSTRR